MRRTHTYANDSDDGHQASVRAVCVIQLFSMADSRTERLCVLPPASNSCRCIAHTYLILPLLMSAGFPMKYTQGFIQRGGALEFLPAEILKLSMVVIVVPSILAI